MPAVNGKAIRERRRRKGLKLGEFAEAARIAYQTMANIECRGSQVVSIEVVHRFAALLDAEAEELLLTKADAA
jgi:transcriptional regulator with XRE-family HTH domain